MRLYFAAVIASLALAVAAGSARAESVAYTFSTTASGTLGAQPFTIAPVTITFSADTANIVFASSPRSWTVAGSASISVGGIGSSAINTNLSVFNNGVVTGLSRVGGPTDVLDLFLPGVANYGLTAPFGPALATSQGMNWTEAPVVSGLGTVVLTSASPFTFQASRVPAPGAAGVLAMGGLLAARRCRR
jgi:hypothetical protein